MKFYSFFLLGMFCVCWSCSSSINNIKDYYKYLHAEENGLVKNKSIGNILLTMKYLPADFFVYRASESSSEISWDSLKKVFEPNISFLLKIAPSENATVKFDVMTETVSSQEEFQEKVFMINFDLQKYLNLKIGKKEAKPVLVEMENVYGLTKHRLINIVFAKEDFEKEWANATELDLIFKDELYGTGMHHFVFDKKDIENIPPLKI